MNNRIYTNSSATDFVEVGQGSLSREIATRASIDGAFLALYNILPNPDPVLRKTGQSVEILAEIARDPQVSACSTSREAGVMAMKWKIEKKKASARAVEIATAIFGNIGLRTFLRETSQAWGYGYQVGEVLWSREGDMLLPAKIIGKPQRWFMFGQENDLRRRAKLFDFNGVPVEEHLFLPTQYRASYDNPYGESQYSMCFWPVTFKKGGLKFWAVFLEKFGMPHAYGKLPRGAQDTERAKLLTSLANMVRDAVAVLPDDASAEFLETSNVSGSAELYERYADYHDAQISKVLLGHSAANTSTPGKLGNEDMALEARADIVDSDAQMIQDTADKLIAWVHELNPSLGAERPAFVLYRETDVDTDRAERDNKLAATGQVKFKKLYFLKRYDYEDEDIDIVDAPATAQAPVAQFSASPDPEPTSPAQAEIDLLVDGLPGDTLQSQVETFLKPVLSLVNGAKSYEEVRTGAAKLFPALATDQIELAIEKAVLLGNVLGQSSARSK